jgi:hypothetical protein
VNCRNPLAADQKPSEMIMTSISMPGRPQAALEEKQTTIGDAVGRAITRFTESRAQAAERFMSARFAALSDGELARLGFSAGEVAAFRGGEPVSRILGRR